jgi:DNA-binding MarR family transcriptional regulator
LPVVADEDLGALLARCTRRVIAEEGPLLAELDLSMWAYIVLSRLSAAPTETQLALAKAINYDKTRLIGLLDELEREGLITRRPDPTDRRARIVRLTPEGDARHAAARRAIHAMEDRLLAGASASDRRRLWRMLADLSSDVA